VRQGGATVAPLVVVLALVSQARSQEPPLLDQWLETYQASRKVGWEHLVVEQTTDPPGYRIERQVWTPLGEDLLQVSEVAHVDSSGTLSSLSRHERWPDDRHTRYQLTQRGRHVLATRTPNRGPERSVQAPGPLLAWRLLGLRHARGESVTGERHAYLLELPGAVSRPELTRVTIAPDRVGLRLEVSPLRAHFDTQGRLTRIDHLERIATISLSCTQAEAEDASRSRPVPQGLGSEGQLPFPLHGFELRPPNREWLLTRHALGRGLSLGLEHPSGTRIRILHVPEFTPTRDRPTCERLAARLVASPPDPRLELTDPRLATHGDNLALVFGWRERGRALPAREGEAMLLPGREGGLLVLASAPEGAADPNLALRAIRLLPTRRETITLTELGLRFAIPARWEELEPGDYTSPDRLARFTVERVEISILTKPSAYQRQLLGNLARLVADAVTDDRLGELAGRPGRLVTIRGAVRGQEQGPPARIHCAIFVEGQVLIAVTAVAIGSGRSGAELDDVWASTQWRVGGGGR